jgi:2-dehydropantoate 2-reductase
MRVGVVGAGAIGRFLAAEISEGGAPVAVLARRPGARPISATRVDGRPVVPSAPLEITTSPSLLAPCDVVLVAVKGSDTQAAAEMLATVLSADAVVVSMQNGLSSAPRLRRVLGGLRVAGGVVTYNVFLDASGHVRQATSGPLLVEALPPPRGLVLAELSRVLARGGDRLELRRDIERVQEGKLLVNLNNGVCAATGLGIAASLRDADARACFAMCLDEGLEIMRAAGRHPARVTALPPALLSLSLRLPDAWVSRLAKRLAKVEEAARSSTLQDLDRGRRTEIDELNGALVLLAEAKGLRAPVNEIVTRIVHEHEEAVLRGARPSFISAGALRALLERASRERSA